MREIIFRGKRIDNGKWVEGFYTCFNGKEHRIYSGYAETDCGDYYPDSDNIDPKTVGEYTGLTDSNGKKIFEGDIVKADNGHISEVTFHFGAFRCYCQCHDTHNTLWSDILTVIGNIHDNPELLKGGADNG